MAPIPAKLRALLASDPFMRVCIWNNSDCSGRVEWEHAWTYAGKQVQERWSIVPCCTYHHRGKGLVKEFNQYISLSRATEEDMQKYARLDLKTKWFFLKEKYFNFNPRT